MKRQTLATAGTHIARVVQGLLPTADESEGRRSFSLYRRSA